MNRPLRVREVLDISQDFDHFKTFSCCCCFGFGLKGPALAKVGKCPPMLTWPVYPRLAQECPLPKAYSSPSDFSLCSSPNYRHFHLFYEKPYLFNGFFFSSQNLKGILWVYNANCIMHKFCCVKVSILNI